MEIKTIIRKTTNDDKEHVFALGEKNIDSYERTHLGDELADSYLSTGAYQEDISKYFEDGGVALENDKIIGFILVKGNEIRTLSVDENYWGKGIAQRLIAFATNELLSEHEEIQLECFITSPRANRFFRKIGFELGGVSGSGREAKAVYKRRLKGIYLTPKDMLLNWVDTFNRNDAEALSKLYREDATNHQVVTDPIVGRDAIYENFAKEFSEAEMVCVLENIFQEGEWAMMEWKDPKGFRGCGFFNFIGDEIAFQRGYMDSLSFRKANNLPLE